ncbi:MAG TPA: hypothetical protein VGM05_28940, partial [Planctomycetaceae bacterium]
PPRAAATPNAERRNSENSAFVFLNCPDVIRSENSKCAVVLTARYPAARRDDVMNMLVKIISEQLCIPADEITPEKSFVDDLGV